MSTAVRVHTTPRPSLALLGLRIQATAAAYRAHLEAHDCQELSWCSEREALADHNDHAAREYAAARMGGAA